MKIDTKSGAGYHRVISGEGKVAYSVEIDDMVIADYDEQGTVLGIEFLEASKHSGDVEKYVKLAKQKSKAHTKPPRRYPTPVDVKNNGRRRALLATESPCLTARSAPSDRDRGPTASHRQARAR